MDYQRIFESDFNIKKIKYRGNQGTGLWTCFSGCGEGNTYQFAKRLNLPNYHQYIDNIYEDSNINRYGGYRLKNTLKRENKQVLQDKNMEKINALKKRYRKQVNKNSISVEKWLGK